MCTKELGIWDKNCLEGSPEDEDLAEYNKLDKTITEAMLAAEKRLPKRRERGWTAEIKKLVHQDR